MQRGGDIVAIQQSMLPSDTTSESAVLPNGTEMHWFACGSGTPVVLLHGFPSCPATFAGLAHLLAKKYRVILPHLRGYGPTRAHSPKSSAYSAEAIAEDVYLMVNHLGFDAIHLVGHDWGAGVAWELALTHPHSPIQSVSILNAILPQRYFFHKIFRSGQILRSWYMLFFQTPVLPEYLLKRLGPERYARLMRRFSVDLPMEQCQESLPVSMITAANDFGGVHYYRAAARQSAPPERVLSIPGQVIYGCKDPALGTHFLDDSVIRPWAEHLTLHALPNTGHWPHLEATATVHTLLTHFWEGNA